MICRLLLLTSLILLPASLSIAEPLKLQLRSQHETSPGSGRFHRTIEEQNWKPEETALILCDVWDSHTCWNAVKRLEQFVPRLNETVNKARAEGVTIIHAPSGCMDAYVDHPARKRAASQPKADNLPEEITKWCYQIPAEEAGQYPIDQTDGGNDDTPEEKKTWLARLEAEQRNPKRPWQKQHPGITIVAKHDFISDKGDEVWSILEDRGIKNVIVAGVHTNMCVLGRPFGLRQMVRNGKNAVLLRDMTDTMYNPASAPYVCHFAGTDLIISHIEKFVCPTITSNQFIGGKPFRFEGDKRPDLLMVIAEDEYKTEETLPPFAEKHLSDNFRVSFAFGTEEGPFEIKGIEQLADADIALFSVRRKVIPKADMQIVRDYVASGKPIVGIRTASHAFYIKQPPPEGYADWERWDQEIFGGNYHNHYKNDLKSTVRVDQDVKSPILKGIDRSKTFPQGWSLYKVLPLEPGATPLMYAEIEGYPEEPVAWTFKRADGGRSFYTSLGNVDDFKHPTFIKLLKNGIHWAAGKKIEADEKSAKAD